MSNLGKNLIDEHNVVTLLARSPSLKRLGAFVAECKLFFNYFSDFIDSHFHQSSQVFDRKDYRAKKPPPSTSVPFGGHYIAKAVTMNSQARDAIPYSLLHRHFEIQVLKTPNNDAVQFGHDEPWSYDKLNKASNRLARYLVGPINPEISNAR